MYKTFISLCPVAIETILFAGLSFLRQFLAEKSYPTRLRYSIDATDPRLKSCGIASSKQVDIVGIPDPSAMVKVSESA